MSTAKQVPVASNGKQQEVHAHRQQLQHRLVDLITFYSALDLEPDPFHPSYDAALSPGNAYSGVTAAEENFLSLWRSFIHSGAPSHPANVGQPSSIQGQSNPPSIDGQQPDSVKPPDSVGAISQLSQSASDGANVVPLQDFLLEHLIREIWSQPHLDLDLVRLLLRSPHDSGVLATPVVLKLLQLIKQEFFDPEAEAMRPWFNMSTFLCFNEAMSLTCEVLSQLDYKSVRDLLKRVIDFVKQAPESESAHQQQVLRFARAPASHAAAQFPELNSSTAASDVDFFTALSRKSSADNDDAMTVVNDNGIPVCDVTMDNSKLFRPFFDVVRGVLNVIFDRERLHLPAYLGLHAISREQAAISHPLLRDCFEKFLESFRPFMTLPAIINRAHLIPVYGWSTLSGIFTPDLATLSHPSQGYQTRAPFAALPSSRAVSAKALFRLAIVQPEYYDGFNDLQVTGQLIPSNQPFLRMQASHRAMEMIVRLMLKMLFTSSPPEWHGPGVDVGLATPRSSVMTPPSRMGAVEELNAALYNDAASACLGAVWPCYVPEQITAMWTSFSQTLFYWLMGNGFGHEYVVERFLRDGTLVAAAATCEPTVPLSADGGSLNSPIGRVGPPVFSTTFSASGRDRLCFVVYALALSMSKRLESPHLLFTMIRTMYSASTTYVTYPPPPDFNPAALEALTAAATSDRPPVLIPDLMAVFACAPYSIWFNCCVKLSEQEELKHSGGDRTRQAPVKVAPMVSPLMPTCLQPFKMFLNDMAARVLPLLFEVCNHNAEVLKTLTTASISDRPGESAKWRTLSLQAKQLFNDYAFVLVLNHFQCYADRSLHYSESPLAQKYQHNVQSLYIDGILHSWTANSERHSYVPHFIALPPIPVSHLDVMVPSQRVLLALITWRNLPSALQLAAVGDATGLTTLVASPTIEMVARGFALPDIEYIRQKLLEEMVKWKGSTAWRESLRQSANDKQTPTQLMRVVQSGYKYSLYGVLIDLFIFRANFAQLPVRFRTDILHNRGPMETLPKAIYAPLYPPLPDAGSHYLEALCAITVLKQLRHTDYLISEPPASSGAGHQKLFSVHQCAHHNDLVNRVVLIHTLQQVSALGELDAGMLEVLAHMVAMFDRFYPGLRLSKYDLPPEMSIEEMKVVFKCTSQEALNDQTSRFWQDGWKEASSQIRDRLKRGNKFTFEYLMCDPDMHYAYAAAPGTSEASLRQMTEWDGMRDMNRQLRNLIESEYNAVAEVLNSVDNTLLNKYSTEMEHIWMVFQNDPHGYHDGHMSGQWPKTTFHPLTAFGMSTAHFVTAAHPKSALGSVSVLLCVLWRRLVSELNKAEAMARWRPVYQETQRRYAELLSAHYQMMYAAFPSVPPRLPSFASAHMMLTNLCRYALMMISGDKTSKRPDAADSFKLLADAFAALALEGHIVPLDQLLLELCALSLPTLKENRCRLWLLHFVLVVRKEPREMIRLFVKHFTLNSWHRYSDWGERRMAYFDDLVKNNLFTMEALTIKPPRTKDRPNDPVFSTLSDPCSRLVRVIDFVIDRFLMMMHYPICSTEVNPSTSDPTALLCPMLYNLAPLFGHHPRPLTYLYHSMLLHFSALRSQRGGTEVLTAMLRCFVVEAQLKQTTPVVGFFTPYFLDVLNSIGMVGQSNRPTPDSNIIAKCYLSSSRLRSIIDALDICQASGHSATLYLQKLLTGRPDGSNSTPSQTSSTNVFSFQQQDIAMFEQASETFDDTTSLFRMSLSTPLWPPPKSALPKRGGAEGAAPASATVSAVYDWRFSEFANASHKLLVCAAIEVMCCVETTPADATDLVVYTALSHMPSREDEAQSAVGAVSQKRRQPHYNYDGMHNELDDQIYDATGGLNELSTATPHRINSLGLLMSALHQSYFEEFFKRHFLEHLKNLTVGKDSKWLVDDLQSKSNIDSLGLSRVFAVDNPRAQFLVFFHAVLHHALPKHFRCLQLLLSAHENEIITGEVDTSLPVGEVTAPELQLLWVLRAVFPFLFRPTSTGTGGNRNYNIMFDLGVLMFRVILAADRAVTLVGRSLVYEDMLCDAMYFMKYHLLGTIETTPIAQLLPSYSERLRLKLSHLCSSAKPSTKPV